MYVPIVVEQGERGERSYDIYSCLLYTSFASVGPMILIGQQHDITTIYGAIIVAGLFTFLVAPFFSRLIRLFPPVVTGTIITIIGINLMPVAVNWMGGGVGNKNFGDPLYIALGVATDVYKRQVLMVCMW